MIWSRASFVLSCVLAFAFILLCMLGLAGRGGVKPTVRKKLSHRIADSVRIFDTKADVDHVSFDSCSIEKMRTGPITFGGLDVVRVKGLVLNLPSHDKSPETHEAASGSEKADSTSLAAAFLGKSSLPIGNVSGIRIDGLRVNKIVGGKLTPVFAADTARNKGRTLALSNCLVYRGEKPVPVGKAKLELSPEPVLAWNGGSRRLDDVFESCPMSYSTTKERKR